MNLGEEPVVLANVFIPPALKPAAINLVTLDFPLVPFICTRIGILAIVAKSLGAKQIIGVEYDSVCEENFMENLVLNNMSEINFIQGDATTWMNFNFDVVLANINRNILLDVIPNMKNATGTIILSGLLTTDEDMMRQVCNNNGLNVKAVNIKGEWISMELTVA